MLSRAFSLKLRLWLSAASLLMGGPAHALDLVLWMPGYNHPPMILAVPEGSTPKEAARRYVERINRDPRIAALRKSGALEITAGWFKPFPPAGAASHGPLFGIAVNELSEMDYRRTPRIRNLIRNLERQGASPYAVPLMGDIALSPKEAQEYRKKVSLTLDALLAKGGPDIEPSLYGQRQRSAVDPVLERDESELSLIREFAHQEHGMLYGICRGHQLCAIAHGHELIQDIEAETAAPSHSTGLEKLHKIKLDHDSLLYRILGQDEIEVNSTHHQAVLPQEGSALRVTARSTDPGNLVEATEFRNGLGFTFQFHPELMENETGRKILRAMVAHAEMVRKNRTLRDCMTGFSGIKTN